MSRMCKNETIKIRVGLAAKAEAMTIDAAARALGLLARWATRRLQRRVAERATTDVAISGKTSKSYRTTDGEN